MNRNRRIDPDRNKGRVVRVTSRIKAMIRELCMEESFEGALERFEKKAGLKETFTGYIVDRKDMSHVKAYIRDLPYENEEYEFCLDILDEILNFIERKEVDVRMVLPPGPRNTFSPRSLFDEYS